MAFRITALYFQSLDIGELHQKLCLIWKEYQKKWKNSEEARYYVIPAEQAGSDK